MIVTNCVKNARPFLMVAENSYAVSVCAKRITEDLQSVEDDLEGIWLIARQGIETADFATTINDPSEDGVLAASLDPSVDDLEISDRTRRHIITLLHEQSAPKPFSLPAHISQRMAVFRNQAPGLEVTFEEAERLADVNVARIAIEDLNDEESTPEDFQFSYRHFDRAWERLQESRARYGLVIMGNRNMAQVAWPSEGTKLWGRLVDWGGRRDCCEGCGVADGMTPDPWNSIREGW